MKCLECEALKVGYTLGKQNKNIVFVRDAIIGNLLALKVFKVIIDLKTLILIRANQMVRPDRYCHTKFFYFILSFHIFVMSSNVLPLVSGTRRQTKIAAITQMMP